LLAALANEAFRVMIANFGDPGIDKVNTSDHNDIWLQRAPN
jgi:hypothetical protein